jgi:hypothetical protein
VWTAISTVSGAVQNVSPYDIYVIEGTVLPTTLKGANLLERGDSRTFTAATNTLYAYNVDANSLAPLTFVPA